MQSDDEFSLEDFEYLSPEEQQELLDIICPPGELNWTAQRGPQQMAFESEAEIIGYGGAAGGGKTDLLIGLGGKKHRRVLVVRREKEQTKGIVQRMTEILGNTDGYSTQGSAWRLPGGRLFEFAGLDNPGDERRWQGRPHDLKAFDEVTEMRESQVRFIMGWNRSSDPGQRVQTLMTFNPPTTSEGQWVIRYFAPWLDESHPNPAAPGELRWFTTLPDEHGQPTDIEVPDNRPFVMRGGERVYDFDPATVRLEDVIRPRSRTFIPARVTDNKYYVDSGYMSTLQAMPEPQRSQMLYGDFKAGMKDSAWQVIPTEWVKAAMARWFKPNRKPPMQSMGVDVARGGTDMTVIARRHGVWFDELVCLPGTNTPDGPHVAGQIVANRRDAAVVHIDAIGVGASPYDFLIAMQVQAVGVIMSHAATAMDKSGTMSFLNRRTQMWWQLREALDPANNFGLCLPPDPKLLADLCAPIWKPQGKTIVVESREDIIKRIGRSPDRGTAVCLAWMNTMKVKAAQRRALPQQTQHTDPLDMVRRRLGLTR